MNIIKKKAGAMILFGVFFSAAAFLFLVLTQKNFKSSADILVVQNQAGFSDYYTLSRSADYLSNVLMESVYSQRFIEEVMNSGKVDANFLPQDRIGQMKTWQNVVKVNKNSDVGIITLSVYGNNAVQTQNAANAVIDVLVNKHSLFLGDGQNIDVRVLTDPMVENNPTILQIILSAGSGFIFGVILIFVIAYYKQESNQFEKIILKEKKKETSITFKNENEAPANELPNEYFSENSDYWKKRLESTN
jgi:capsular polysaccharide biosynthesis protein